MDSKPGLWFRISILTGLIAMFAFVFTANKAHGVSSVNVSLDHWTYEMLDKLEGFGLINSRLSGTKPYSRREMARLVLEAIGSEAYKNKKVPPLIEYMIGKFTEEFRTELDELRPDNPSVSSKFLQPITEAQVRYVYVDGQPHRFTTFAKVPTEQIKATEGTPLMPNNEGVNYSEHNNFSLQFSSSARLYDIFSFYVEPIFIARENKKNTINLDSFEPDLHKGYVKISPWNIELQVGRDSLWLGQGYHGTLLVSDNAPPFYMIKLSNPSPIVLPSFLNRLGLFNYTVFVARLEEDRDFPHAMLGGGRIEFKPFPLLELGGTYALMFGGEGAPSIGAPGGFGGGNTIASMDIRIRLPFLRNAQIYAEYGGEDTPSKNAYWYEFAYECIGYVLGIYFPSVFEDGKTDLRIEYANNAFKRQPDSHTLVWYTHWQYTSGYTYDGMIMGHHMGPDASDFFVRATHYLTNRFKLGVDYDYMERGITLIDNAIERTNSVGFDLTYDIKQYLSITGRYSFGLVTNFNNVKGDDRQDNVFQMALKASF